MSWLRSRRFYAGMAIGLFPLLLLAAAQNDRTVVDGRTDGHPVVVRTYAGCCPDSTDADRTAALLEALPENVVLVETFTGCCCGDTTRVYGPTSARSITVPPYPITGTGPGVGGPRVVTPPTAETPRGATPAVAVVPPLIPGPTRGFAAPGGYLAPSAPVQAGVPGWLGMLAAPLLFLTGTGDFGDGEPLPDGVLCPDDSGLPIGPNRPRC